MSFEKEDSSPVSRAIGFSESVRNSIVVRRILGALFHAAGIAICWLLSFFVRFDFGTSESYFLLARETMWLSYAVYVPCILAFRLYQGLWRFFTFRDCLVTGTAFATGSIGLAIAVFIWNESTFEGFPRSIFLINFMLLMAWEIGGRGLVRLIREWRIERSLGRRYESRPNVVLIGNPEECDPLIRSLNRQAGQLGEIVAIITSSRSHRGGRLHGIRVYADLEKAGVVVRECAARSVIILPPFNAPSRVREVIDSVSKENVRCEFRVLPSIDDIAAGRVDVSKIRRVEIEDLLNRKAYDIDLERLREFVSEKRLLVTGAGGSIGSEICRQLLGLGPKVLVLFDVSEFLLFEIERELKEFETCTELIAVAGDVKKTGDIQSAIAMAGGIDVIYHAAAYKHVDLMERNPVACFENNVIGTAKLAEVAEEVGVTQFVLISSDKAVRPTSLMGASKRLAEMALIDRPYRGTQFRAVRFGNVLGSSGSVVPIFRKQIEIGGPVTVTSPEVTRFFMTIPEAVELVLVASAIGEDRRVLVLEMGEPVKIVDLAKRMIELSGFVPDVDIPIVFTGLKPGEKEYEELLTEDENVVRTEVDRIWVVQESGAAEGVRLHVGDLLELIDEGCATQLRAFAHSIIPGSRLLPGATETKAGTNLKRLAI